MVSKRKQNAKQNVEPKVEEKSANIEEVEVPAKKVAIIEEVEEKSANIEEVEENKKPLFDTVIENDKRSKTKTAIKKGDIVISNRMRTTLLITSVSLGDNKVLTFAPYGTINMTALGFTAKDIVTGKNFAALRKFIASGSLKEGVLEEEDKKDDGYWKVDPVKVMAGIPQSADASFSIKLKDSYYSNERRKIALKDREINERAGVQDELDEFDEE